MTLDYLADPALRILGPRATILGIENSIDSIDPTILPNGALVACNENGYYYRLSKTSTAVVDNDNVIATRTGVGRWLKLASGSQGPAGATGATGPAGPEGPAGAVGATGPAGPEGPAGAVGATGPAGADGAIGPEGPAGAVGATGPAGADGAIGPEGPQGPIGPTGPAGADGAVGPEGPEGPIGPTGATGPEGPSPTQTWAQVLAPPTGAAPSGGTSPEISSGDRLLLVGPVDVVGSLHGDGGGAFLETPDVVGGASPDITIETGSAGLDSDAGDIRLLGGDSAGGEGGSGGTIIARPGTSSSTSSAGQIRLEHAGGEAAIRVAHEVTVAHPGGSAIIVTSSGLAFFNGSPAVRPSVTGSRGGNAALASLLTVLDSMGLITNDTTA